MPETRSNWIYLFHGEDDLSSREAVGGLLTRMKESPVWECNVSYFEGQKVALMDLLGTCQTVPFLADKRLVVVANLISHLAGGASREESRPERSAKGGKKAFVDGLQTFLPGVPEFCRLVFLEEQQIPDRDPVLKTIQSLGGIIRAHRLEERNLAGWIRDRAVKVGCRMAQEAAEELALAVGPNARLLDSELVKLATYCLDRTVMVEDVRSLVGDARKANVFAMVDAVGSRQPELALRELRKLVAEGDHPLRILSLMARQFRLLIQVKELTGSSASPDEIAQKTGTFPRAVANLQRQARTFTFLQLDQAYRQLLNCDLQVKSGAWEPESALELLVLDLLKAA